MATKFCEARRKAFLAALRETGNKTLAAERARVSRSWIIWLQSEDAAFGRAVKEAVAEARERLCGSSDRARGARGVNATPRGWGFLDGAELVVRGTGGSGGGKRVQIARARLSDWSPRVENRFLATLASTCNVQAACTEVGLSKTSAYARRRRWPAFARRWDAAIEEGYLRLEMGLIEAAGNFLSGEHSPDAVPLTGMTVDQAIHLLHLHKRTVHGIGKPPSLPARWPDIEDIRAEILRKVEVIERHDPRRLAKDRAEWARRRPS